jgi:hypothetical protein
MKLQELFTLLPEDYGRLPPIPPNLPSFDPKYSKVVGTFDGLDIWGSRELAGFDIFGIRDTTGDALSYLIVSNADIGGAFPLRELWTASDARGCGYATILLSFVLRKLGRRIILTHDEVVSDDARSFILKGADAGKFKVHTATGRVVTPGELQQTFSQLGKTDTELVLSESVVPYDLFGMEDGGLKEPWYVRGEVGLD